MIIGNLGAFAVGMISVAAVFISCGAEPPEEASLPDVRQKSLALTDYCGATVPPDNHSYDNALQIDGNRPDQIFAEFDAENSAKLANFRPENVPDTECPQYRPTVDLVDSSDKFYAHGRMQGCNCRPWTLDVDRPFSGSKSYSVTCVRSPEEPEVVCDDDPSTTERSWRRRSEQKILSRWFADEYPNYNSGTATRYISFAFRLNLEDQTVLQPDEDTKEFIAQLHYGPLSPPFNLKWRYDKDNDEYTLVSSIASYSKPGFRDNGEPDKVAIDLPPADEDLAFLAPPTGGMTPWYRVVIAVDPGPAWEYVPVTDAPIDSGDEQCSAATLREQGYALFKIKGKSTPTVHPGGKLSVYLMKEGDVNWTEMWTYDGSYENDDEVFSSRCVSKLIGHTFNVVAGKPPDAVATNDTDTQSLVLRDNTNGSNDIKYEWKLGIYGGDRAQVTQQYDDIAYGTRWRHITKNYLVGYRKSVLHYDFIGPTLSGALQDRSGSLNCSNPPQPSACDGECDYCNHGTAVGSAATNGYYLMLDGNSHVERSVDADFDFANQFSVSLWYQATDSGNSLWSANCGLFTLDTGTSDWVSTLYIARDPDNATKGKIGFGVRHADQAGTRTRFELFSRSEIFEPKFHHVVGTFNRFEKRVRLYLDGKRIHQETPKLDSPLKRASTKVSIGQYYRTDPILKGFFKGFIDDVRVFNYELPEEDLLSPQAEINQRR